MGKAQEIPFGELLVLIIKSSSGDATEKSEIPIDKLSLRDLIISISPKDESSLDEQT